MTEVAQHGAAQQGKGLSIAGMVLGICSLVLVVWLGFILGVLAIIFSAIALKRKRNGMAIAGLVTGIIATVASVVIGIAFVGIVSYAGITQRANDSAVVSAATTVQKQAEAYNAEHNLYPSFEQMQYDLSAQGYSVTIDRQGVGSSGNVIYIPCYGDGAIIWYWSEADQEYKSLYAGLTDTCEWNE